MESSCSKESGFQSGAQPRFEEVAGDDGEFVSATAKIERDKVVVSSDAVEKPAAVRYGWANTPDVNLWNKAGLPATPFRTDVK
jgi:sialate O-acetylesterase